MKQKIRKILNYLGIEIRLIKSLEKEKNIIDFNPFEMLSILHKKSECTIFDIGAYDGQISKLFIEKFPNATIHAFEPFPESFEKLKLISEKFNSITINNVAVSNFNGIMKLNINNFLQTNSLFESNNITPDFNSLIKTVDKIDVHVITLDEYCQNNNISMIDILKIDVQGSELEVLKGSNKLLETKQIKNIFLEIEFVEIYKKQPLFYEIYTFLKSKDYELYNFYNLCPDKNGKLIWADAIFTLS